MGFMEELLNRKFDLAEEILSLNKLLNENREKQDYEFGYASIEKVVSIKFREWKHCSNYIELYQMKRSMGIKDILDNSLKNIGITVNEYIQYVEYAINISAFCEKYMRHQNIKLIIHNIENVLDFYNYKLDFLPQKDIYIVVPKEYETEFAVEIIREPNLCENIIMYNHHSNKGNVFNKAIILSRLFMYYEKNLEQTITNINNTLDKEIGELSNKLKIRHDKPNRKEELVVGVMTDEELEKWYDKLFALYLRTIILVENLKVKPEIEELRRRLNQGN